MNKRYELEEYIPNFDSPNPKQKLENSIKNTTILPSLTSLKATIKEKILFNYICEKHHCDFSKFCATCKIDICQNCEIESHSNHKFINYDNILPDLNEISSMKKYLKDYETNYKKLSEFLINWKNNIDFLYKNFIKQMTDTLEFVSSFDYNKINFNSIFKYRNIFDMIIDDINENKNSKIMKLMLSYYTNEDNNTINKIQKDFENFLPYNKMKEILFSFNQKNNFIDNSQKIINILSKQNNHENPDINLTTANFANYNSNPPSSSVHKNTSASTSKRNKHLTSSSMHNFFRTKLNLDNNTEFTINDKKNNIPISYDKKTCCQNSIDCLNKKNVFPAFPEMQDDFIKNHKRNHTVNFNNSKKNILNFNNLLQNSINKITIDSNSYKNTNSINTNIYKKANRIYDAPIKTSINKNNNTALNDYKEFDVNDKDSCSELPNTSSHTMTGYKYSSNAIELRRNSFDNKPILKYYDNINRVNSDANYHSIDKKLNSKFNNNILNNIYLNKNENEKFINNQKEKKVYIHKKFTHNEIKKNLSCFDINNYNSDSSIISNNISNSNEFHIKHSKPLYMGLELGNTSCKLGFATSENNIELYKSNTFSIPSIISFDNKNGEILIGNEADDLRISNSNQTFFNLVKLLGKNSNEIKGKTNLFPFKLYNDEKNNKPYVKVSVKIYYIEDLLILYLKKLFDVFFSKIIIENNINNKYNTIEINLVISVPNNYTYHQRMIIEKIFRNNLFPNINNIAISKNSEKIIKTYGRNYVIRLNGLKIENITNLAAFSLSSKNDNQIKNILVLNIDGSLANISIINKNNKNTLEVKISNSITFDDEDFIDNFLYKCLNDFKETVKNNCLNCPESLAKLRKSFEIINDLFCKDISQTEININKIYENTDLKMTVNKCDFENSCLNVFKKIISLIKDTIYFSTLSLFEINDIILIGQMAKNIKFKQLLISEIFRENKIITQKLLINDNNTNENLCVVIGAILNCVNSNKKIQTIKLNNISNFSFGVETLNGVMDCVIKKGSLIPIKVNKMIKVRKTGSIVCINVYEGENRYTKNNKLITRCSIDVNHFKNEKPNEEFYEVLLQFCIDLDNKLKIYILDKNTKKRKFECLINNDE